MTTQTYSSGEIGPSPMHAALSQPQLHEWLSLDELHEGADRASGVRDRMTGLIEAIDAATSGCELETALGTAITRKAFELGNAHSTILAVPDEETSVDVAQLLVVAAAGSRDTTILGAPIPISETVIGSVYRSQKAIRINETISADIGGRIIAAGPALIVPLRTADSVVGILAMIRFTGEASFTDGEVELIEAFADGAALALQSANSRRRLRELDIFAERERIAHELGDHVIQQLFSIGLSLQGVVSISRMPLVKQRVGTAVDDLQALINQFRAAVFNLPSRSDTKRVPGLRQRIEDVVAQETSGSDAQISYSFAGPQSVVDSTLADLAEEVVRDAIHNSVTHVHPSAITVSVCVEDDLAIHISVDGGTILKWTAPLP